MRVRQIEVTGNRGHGATRVRKISARAIRIQGRDCHGGCSARLFHVPGWLAGRARARSVRITTCTGPGRSLCKELKRGAGVPIGAHAQLQAPSGSQAPSALDPRGASIWGGAYRYRRFIVDLSSLSRAPGSIGYRRYTDDMSTICRLHIDDI